MPVPQQRRRMVGVVCHPRYTMWAYSNWLLFERHSGIHPNINVGYDDSVDYSTRVYSETIVRYTISLQEFDSLDLFQKISTMLIGPFLLTSFKTQIIL
jgi:hypothetical protein